MHSFFLSLFFVFAIIHGGEVFAANLTGQLFEKGTKKALAGVNIFVLPQKLKAVSEANGSFRVENLAVGPYELIVNSSGYLKLQKEGQISEPDSNERVNLYLEKVSYTAFETTILGAKQKKDDAQKSMTREQFLAVPGAGGDPVKAVQNLPGVNRVGGFSSQVVIQGSAPKDTSYGVDGHEIPLVFHFGGLSSVIMPEALDSVDYYSAGYGSESSRALGGIISLQTRKPEIADRPSRGFFFVDTLKLGGMFETQIDEKSSILVSGRYSYVGLLLSKVFEKNADFNLTVAPDFADFTTIYHRQINADEDLKVVALASRDTLGFVLKQPFQSDPGLRGNFSNETQFYRLIPQWSRRLDASQSVKFSVGVGQDQVLLDVGQNYFYLKSEALSTRGEWEKSWGSPWNWKTTLGFDNNYGRAQVQLRLPNRQEQGGVDNPASSGDIREQSITGKINNVGTFWRNEFEVGPWTLIPALRLDSYSQTKEKILQPRMAFRHQWSEDLKLRGAGGIFSQAPEPQESDPTFGNPDIRSPRALHWMLGFDQDFRRGRQEGITLSGGLFDRWFEKLVVPSTQTVIREGTLVSENRSNQGQGRAYGLEAQLKFEDQPNSGWISYTWSKSTRWQPDQPETRFEFDQTHNFNIVASRDLGAQWKVSVRFRYVTGNPLTPVVGAIFDADNDVFIPRRGEIFSLRAGDFSQLDLRLDKKYIFDREIWSIYLDIQNLLSQKNAESIQYSYDYRQNETVSGLPLLPTFGVKGEF